MTTTFMHKISNVSNRVKGTVMTYNLQLTAQNQRHHYVTRDTQ